MIIKLCLPSVQERRAIATHWSHLCAITNNQEMVLMDTKKVETNQFPCIVGVVGLVNYTPHPDPVQGHLTEK